MDDAFESFSQNLASYRWGSLIVRPSRLQPADQESLRMILGGLSAGVAPWRSAREFRLTAALLHESVHLLQDLTTGIGHFDHIVRYNTNNAILKRCAVLNGNATLFPSSDPELRELKDKYLNSVRYVRTSAIPAQRTSAIRSYLRTTVELPENAVLDSFLVESIVEAEAAVATYLILAFELQMSDEQRKIAGADEHLGLFDIWKMPTIYRDLFGMFASNVVIVDASRKSEEIGFQLQFAGRVFLQLIDWALAHPSSRLVSAPYPLESFEPGVRFIQLSRAVHALDETEFREFFAALGLVPDVDLDLAKAEAILERHVEGPYLNSQIIYTDWELLLEALLNQVGVENEMMMARLHATRLRLADRSEFHMKSPLHAASWGLPFHFLTPAGVAGFKAIVDPVRVKNFWLDWLNDNSDMAWADCFVKTGAFQCPYAHFQTCDVATERCRTGIRSFNELPADPGCQQRRSLKHFGFHF